MGNRKRLILSGLLLGAILVEAPLGAAPAGDLEALLENRGLPDAVQRMRRWREFLDQGLVGAEEIFGGPGGADHPIALMIEETVAARLRGLVESGAKASLAGHKKAVFRSFEDGHCRLEVKGEEFGVDLANVDLKDWSTLLRTKKAKTDADHATISIVSLFLDDTSNLNRNRTKVKAEPLKGELAVWLEAAGAVTAELLAYDQLAGPVATDDAGAFVSGLEAAWPTVKATALAQLIQEDLRPRYRECKFETLNNPKLLESTLEGSLDATSGGDKAGVEITWEFDSADELGDFTRAEPNRAMLSSLRFMTETWRPPEAWEEWGVVEGTLRNSQANYIESKVPFAEVSEIELHAEVLKDTGADAFLQSFVGVGLVDESSSTYVMAMNCWRLIERRSDGIFPSSHKAMETTPGKVLVCKVVFGEDTTELSRDEEVHATIGRAKVRRGRLFLTGGGPAAWAVHKLVVRGRVENVTLTNLARALAEEKTKSMFGG